MVFHGFSRCLLNVVENSDMLCCKLDLHFNSLDKGLEGLEEGVSGCFLLTSEAAANPSEKGQLLTTPPHGNQGCLELQQDGASSSCLHALNVLLYHWTLDYLELRS